MYKILTASSDNYITNKYINSFRVTDSNVGSAGTLDLYKLYNETSSSDNSVVELSRLLLKFDLTEVRSINENKCKVSHPSFSATLKLFDVYGGQTTPSNFDVSVYPLSKSFDEGLGRDVVKYTDLGASNFITASIQSGEIVKWSEAGANSKGALNDEDIDIIESGDLQDGNGSVNLYKNQSFVTGKEDLEIDVTKIVSGTIANQIPDAGFRVSFSTEIENNQKTYFVKRFASRNANDPTIRPQLVIKYNDVIHDHHKGMNFNISGSLFLNNIVNGSYRNIISGSTSSPGTLEEVSGQDCVLLKVYSGSYSKYITGSSYTLGGITYPGIYSASFLIDKFDQNLIGTANKKSEVSFNTVWTDMSENVPYYSGSITLNSNNTSGFQNSSNRLIISITNLRKIYYKDSIARFRVFVENVDKVIRYTKIPIEKPSEVYYNMKYAVVDVDTGKYIIPFQKNDMSTTLSVDSQGMYFDIDMKSLPPKRIYKIVFLLEDMGQERIFTKTASIFRVV